MKHLYQSAARALPFIISVLLFTACKKDPVSTPTPLPTPPDEPAAKLLKIEREGSPYPIEQYEYNEQGLLSKRTNEMAITSPTSFFYNADKKLVTAKTILVYDNVAYLTYKFYYANERLDKMELINTGYDPGNTKPYTIYKFLYKDNRLFQTIMYIGGGEEESNIVFRTTSMYDSNGDVKVVTHETRDADANTYNFSSEVIFEYDKKINPLKKQAEQLKGFGMNSSANNIIKEIWKEGVDRKTTQVVTRSYTYDSKGLPLTAIEKYDFPEDPGEPPTIQNIKYTYQ